MTKPLGIGIVGGGFVSRFHIRSFESVRGADVRGVVSRRLETAQEAAQLARDCDVGDAQAFPTVTEMVADPSIDAIWICSPNFTRIDVMEEIVAAVKSGAGELVGVACEKPLARNVAEARKMVDLVGQIDVLDGYLENQLFTPAVERVKDVVWSRGAALTGPPYLARAAEEHSGPHMPWFWSGELQGGGVINDMMCHSVEAARFLLTEPGAPRDSLTPVSVNCYASCLKWQQPRYAEQLRAASDGMNDYLKKPSEDYARALVEFRDPDGNPRVVETTTSWCYVGAGLRITMEMLGPEYSMSMNSLDAGPRVFFSREVQGNTGEDLVEKQNAETGMMPVVADEEAEYGYVGENRYMVRAFRNGERPWENFEDGLRVTELLMAAYMSAEREQTVHLPCPELDTFVPAVARGEWNPRASQEEA
ncbi:MAG: gfo/Idh/MocA family oxidoreductase [Acidobacteria bacterium]|nr:gfo/Idh/MocA family oxidoreductase [Acidobacteriota bacterium]